jgi:hypothetical protein
MPLKQEFERSVGLRGGGRLGVLTMTVASRGDFYRKIVHRKVHT